MPEGEPPEKKRQVMEDSSSENVSQIVPEEEKKSSAQCNPSACSHSVQPVDKENFRILGSESMPPIVPSSSHSVLFKLPVVSGRVPEPFVGINKDCWDSQHVRMPFSSHSLYPVDTPTGKLLKPRWELVKEALSKEITCCTELEDAILSYNTRYRQKWDFSGLHTFFSEVLDPSEAEYFFESILPGMVHLALSLPSLIQCPIPLLRRKKPASISFTQKQVASLLANAFFCTFPRRNTAREPSEYSSFPDINFNRLFQGHKWKPKARIGYEKLKCLFHYFRKVCSKDPEGVLTFTRQYCPDNALPKWSESRELIPRLRVSSVGRIEDEGYGMLQVDFANKFVGGGVLGSGCVQEEIQFLIFPELIVSRLFTEALDKTEALVVSGCERFSIYKGYSETFKWAGDFKVSNSSTSGSASSRDAYGRHLTSVVAIDALHFSTPNRQYSQEALLREVNKAYAGFHCPDGISDLPAIATGNWGCGVFRGDAQLKALLQLIAAAKSKRDLVYFTFGDDKLKEDIYSIHKFLYTNKIPIGELWQHLCQYYEHCYRDGSFSSDLYNYLYSVLEEPTPEQDAVYQQSSSGSQNFIESVATSDKIGKSNQLPMDSEDDDIFKEVDLDSFEKSSEVPNLEEKNVTHGHNGDKCLLDEKSVPESCSDVGENG